MGRHHRKVHESSTSGQRHLALFVNHASLIFYLGQLSLINEGVYGPSMWLIKLSLFVLYLEVFGLLKWLRYSAYAGMVLTGIAYFVIMIRFIVLCEPTNGHSRSAYLSVLTSPKCTSTHALILWQGILNVVSDLYLIALPFPALWSMQMPLRKKLGVAAVISTGLM